MTAKKIGRPTAYNEKIAAEICETIACSSKGIKRLVRENEHWPDHSTIYRWIMRHPGFGDQYARAKEYQAEVGVDEIIDIADDGTNDYYINEKGELVPDKENILRSRLRTDVRKWAASKLLARKYGDKLQTESNVNITDGKSVAEKIADSLAEINSPGKSVANGGARKAGAKRIKSK